MKKFENPEIEIMMLTLECVASGDLVDGSMGLGDNEDDWEG